MGQARAPRPGAASRLPRGAPLGRCAKDRSPLDQHAAAAKSASGDHLRWSPFYVRPFAGPLGPACSATFVRQTGCSDAIHISNVYSLTRATFGVAGEAIRRIASCEQCRLRLAYLPKRQSGQGSLSVCRGRTMRCHLSSLSRTSSRAPQSMGPNRTLRHHL